MTPEEIQLNQQIVLWTAFAAIGTTLGVVSAVLLPFIQRYVDNRQKSHNAKFRISFELMQIVRTLTVVKSFKDYSILIRSGKEHFYFQDQFQTHTTFQFTDHRSAMLTIVEEMEKLNNRDRTILGDTIILLRNIFSGSVVEIEKYRKLIENCMGFIRQNIKDKSWILSLEDFIRTNG